MRPLTADKPKSLIEVGGMTLLERIVRQCADVGIREVVVVTGHAAAAVDLCAAQFDVGVRIRTVYNPQYEELNNAHSVWTAREALRGAGFIAFDGDMLIHTRILRRLVAAGGGSTTVVDATSDLGEEEMKARTDERGLLTGLGKWLEPGECLGEAIGLCRFAEADVRGLMSEIERVVHDEGHKSAYYEDVCHRMLSSGWRCQAIDTAGLPWTEVDTIADLRDAQELVARCDKVGPSPVMAASA